MGNILVPKFAYMHEKFVEEPALYVNKGNIESVGSESELVSQYPNAKVVHYPDRVFVPGTVNAHNHSFQSLLRGIAIDKPFLQWRDESLYRFSPQMRREDIYNGALFAFAEMMLAGVTTVCDFFYLHNFGLDSDEIVIQAAKDIGIRLVLARTMYDWAGAPKGYLETVNQAVDNTLVLADKYKDDSMVTIIPAPHSLHAASPEMIVAGHELAVKMHTKFHMHVAEEPFEVKDTMAKHHGKRTIEYLNDLGVVDERLAIVHGVWLSKSEIQLMGEKGASLNYCPSSNMFLADGVTDIPKMANNNINIALGSDGACGNNRISVFEEMRMTALLQKVVTQDALCVKCKQVFDMGTINGAKQLDLNSGAIEVGKAADMVGIDLDDLSMQPMNSDLEQMLPNIVYAMQPTAIKEVFVNGRQTVRAGQLVNVKQVDLLNRIKKNNAAF
ncbi:amidohydrolase family protein [Agrilactobacillus composti]|uniref:amidohydrolase family protein n=1 Tax=Agrilactobacillus composti TaxID=398555 RepID=UPI001268DAB6|nr:amidohydrolase [Agrilactobacillus composti]